MSDSLRDRLTPDERAMPVGHYIDPGFVNERLIETVLGQTGQKIINKWIADLPVLPEWQMRTRLNHIYTRACLIFCEKLGVPSLRELIANGKGKLFCSTELTEPCKNIYEAKRVTIPIKLKGDYSYSAELELGTEHISSDTLRSELHLARFPLSVIASLRVAIGERLIFEPLVIGSPWLEIDDEKWRDEIVWYGSDFYENYLEDFDEFARVAGVPIPSQPESAVMKDVSESAFKQCLAELLGDDVVGDWGGEAADHYTAHLRLRGRPVTAAFLLKGPARFRPMTVTQLGKNGDQIYRMTQLPADVYFVQHSHEITPAVRATLRAFAVQPSRQRRYCLVDGRESLRLLKAYDKLDRALKLTVEGRHESRSRRARKRATPPGSGAGAP